MSFTLVTHPVLEDALGKLRDRLTASEEFRRLAHRASLILAVQATSDLSLSEARVETPLEPTRISRIGPEVVAIPILRAGLGMLPAFLEIVPRASVGFLGLERDEKTAIARCYYQKLPPLNDAVVFLLDPMLATGGSAASASQILAGKGAASLRLLSIVAAPEGVDHLKELAPHLSIFAAALDRGLNSQKFIFPGLGDFGDRLCGTERRDP